MQKIEFRAMGCHMLAIVDTNDARAQDVLASVPMWFEEWENILSRFRADCELNQLNANPGRPVRVSETLFAVLEQSINTARLSNGLVTPTVLDALESAGYDRSFDALNDLSLRGAILSEAERSRRIATKQSPSEIRDWRDIKIDAHARTIELPQGMHLDFGGTSKGWAADLAAKKLSQVAPALVDAGGDIAISGARANGDRWQISIADPFTPENDLEQLVVRSGGIATSGRDFRRWEKNGAPQHHIIDPRTGRPAETDVLTATVIAPSTSQAEVAAKVALILGSQAGLQWIEEQSDLAGMLVLENGQTIESTRFDQYVWRQLFIAQTNLFEAD